MFSVTVDKKFRWAIYDHSLDIEVGAFSDPDEAWAIIDSLPDDEHGRLAVYNAIRNKDTIR